MTDKETKINKVFNGGDASTLVHLNEEQADKFIDYVVEESVILKQARVVRMSKPIKTIAKIGISDDILYPASRGTALDPNKRVSATPEKIQLISKEVIGEVRIYDDELEDNIEGSAFKDHMMRMVAKKIGNQLEKASLYAKKVTNPLTLMGMFDGFIKLIEATGVVVDANVGFTDRYIDKEKLAKLRKSIATKYRSMLNKWYMPDDVAIDYEVKYEASANTVSKNTAFGLEFTKANLLFIDRPVKVTSGYTGTISANITAGATTAVLTDETGLIVGDTFTIALGQAKEFTSTISAINTGTNTITIAVGDTFPFSYASATGSENTITETTEDGADVILTPNYNFIYGIQRDITIEPDRVAKERATDFVITMRIDFQVENTEMAGLLKNVKVR